MKTIMNLSYLVLMAVLSACSQISSNEVDASSIYGELSMKREEGSSQAVAAATFYVGGPTGTIVRMEDPASVFINGQRAIEEDNILNMISYQRTVTGNASLVYTDKDGLTYTNTLLMPGSLSLHLPSSTVFISQGFVLNYSSSSSFASGETLEVKLSGSNGEFMMMNTPLNAGATSGSKTVTSSELSGLSPGNHQLQICRTSYPAAQAPYPKGTSVVIQSCSRETTVNLQP